MRFHSFLQVMNDDAKGSRVEPGCLRFDVLEDGEDRNKFYVYSLWKDSTDAIAHHQKQLHYKVRALVYIR
jgi:autoinducer 2-degrading protein